MKLLEWWKKRKALKEFEESASCEAIYLELVEARLKVKYRRLQLKILKLQEKRLRKHPSYVR